MKKYLEENIKFNTARFTSGIYALILLIGGEIGLFINGNIENKRVLLSIFFGIIIILTSAIFLLNLQNRIKEDINKLKDYE